jgi:Holliday junction resolvase
MAKDQYKYGREKEKKVAKILRSKGAMVELSEASKGAADLFVKYPTRTKWVVQVKSTRTGNAASPSADEMNRLKRLADKIKATAVVAKVSPEGIEYQSAKTGRKLNPPKPKKR